MVQVTLNELIVHPLRGILKIHYYNQKSDAGISIIQDFSVVPPLLPHYHTIREVIKDDA